ncbi:JmjC domain-containing protein 4 [Haplosporangium sp. Z 27]|nr:JmjC domain-containing protein 4 [Haplosporangium sp. Z 27]
MALPPIALHSLRNYSSLTEIPYHESCPSYKTFLEQYLEPNIPVIIGPDLTKHWRARLQWVCPDTGKPNFVNLKEQLCTTPVEVPVADCQCKDFTDQKRSTMDLRAFLEEWEANSIANTPSRTYLKDFHFVRTFPYYDAYETPDIFRDDWMNEFWTRRKDMDDDYRFVYCGGDGTFTPFHADVYRSYSWSANICGIKKWTLFPPNQEHLFYDSLKNTVYDIENVDPVQFPNFHKAKRYTIYQQPGQTLFVPSGWWHQVHNIGDTISINHNWCNGSNLDLLLESICSDLKEVEREIDHLKDTMEEGKWIKTCQKLLLLNSGWDWSTVWHMCVTIRTRVQKQKKSENYEELEYSIFIKDGKEMPRITPIFQPPLISQQPPLDLTLNRIESVLNYIKNDKSARWFLEQIKKISLDDYTT